MELMMISCGMKVRWMGMLRSEGEEDEGTECEDGESYTNW